MFKCKLIHSKRLPSETFEGFTEFPSKSYTSVILCAFSFYLTDWSVAINLFIHNKIHLKRMRRKICQTEHAANVEDYALLLLG